MTFSVEITAIVGAIFLCVIWFVRLEAKVLSMEKNETVVWKHIGAMQTDIRNILLSLSRIEGSLNNNANNNHHKES